MLDSLCMGLQCVGALQNLNINWNGCHGKGYRYVGEGASWHVKGVLMEGGVRRGASW